MRLTLLGRAGLVSSLVGKAAYACEVKSLTVNDERKIKVSTTSATWQKTGRHRNPGVFNTLLTKGHLTDVSQAIFVTRSNMVGLPGVGGYTCGVLPWD